MSLQAQLESLKEATIVKIATARDLKELNQIIKKKKKHSK